VHAIRRVVNGKHTMCGWQTGHGGSQLASTRPRGNWRSSTCSPGLVQRRIAQQWQVSPATVRTHVQNLLVKVGVHSKLETAAFAYRHGTVTVDGRTTAGPPRIPSVRW
jgi:Bacterial regulatory proteins, luxR family